MKLDYINWYLVELKRHLLGRVSSEQEFALCAQTKNHLESLAEEYEGQGMDIEAAQRASIERFGSPVAISRLYIDQILDPAKKVHWILVGLFWTLFVGIAFSGLLSGLLRLGDYAAGQVAFLVGLTVLAALARGKRLEGRFWAYSSAIPVFLAVVIAPSIASIRNDRLQDAKIVSQSSLSETYLQAQRQNEVVTRFENGLMKQWEQILSNPSLRRGLVKGQSLQVPELRYSGSKGIFITPNMKPGETYHKFTTSDLVSLSGTDIKIESVDFRKPEVFVGPVAFEAIQNHIRENQDSVARARMWRQKVVGTLSRTANMHYAEKVAWMSIPTVVAILLIAWPTCWVVSTFALALRRKIKLAWRVLRTA